MAQTTPKYDTQPSYTQLLLNNILGSETDKEASSESTTNNANTATSVGSQNTSSNQSTSGTSGGSSSTVSNQNQSQTGTDRTVSQSASRTIGDTLTQRSGSSSSTQAVSADTSALREVYARQMAGISPEMLAAIFQQGIKQAPQLLVSQANALGARTGNNTPVAAALNMLNSDLTAKAADVNYNMLRDAGSIATQLAEMTKVITNNSSFQETTRQSVDQTTYTSMVQDRVMNQLLQGSTGQSSTQNNYQNTNTVGNQATNTQQTNVNVGTSNTSATEQQNIKQTVNKDIAGGLVGAVTAGVGINELFKIATGKGFVGSMKEFANWLMQMGAPAELIAPQLGQEAGLGIGATPEPGIADWQYQDNPFLGDTGGADLVGPPEANYNWEDLGFADGGSVTPMLDKGAKQEGTDGIDVMQLFDLMVAPAASAALMNSMQGGEQIPQTDAKIPSGERPAGKMLSKEQMDSAANESYMADNPDGSGQFRARTDAAGKRGQITKMGQERTEFVGDQDTTTYDNAPQGFMEYLGMDGRSFVYDVYDANGNHVKTERVENKSNWIEDAIIMAAASLIPGGAAVVAAGNADQAFERGDVGQGLLSAAGAIAGAGSAAGASWAPAANTAVKVVNAGKAASEGNYVGAVTSGYGAAKDLGIVTGKADGGKIEGPGTGISDSVQAAGPNGEPIRLSKDEYIIPADVVRKIGTSFFDRLIQKFHVPADMQRAMGIEK